MPNILTRKIHSYLKSIKYLGAVPLCGLCTTWKVISASSIREHKNQTDSDLKADSLLRQGSYKKFLDREICWALIFPLAAVVFKFSSFGNQRMILF